MATTLEELQVLITAKTAGLRKGLAEVKQRLGETDKAVKQTTASVGKTIKSIPAPKIKTGEMTKSLKETEQKVKQTTASVSKSVSAITKTLGSAGDAIASIKGAKGVGGIVSSLKSLAPAAGAASTSLAGLSGSAAGAGAALGATAAGIGLVIAALGVVVAGIGKASQEAAKFDSALGRLNKQLKGNTRGYMEWATAQGMAKSSAADMGATYSVLLSSFTKDQAKLAEQTKQMVQTTRLVSSWTGLSLEETTERLRSGLLGNTESIEDLGIFVNVSMIESTKAFKQFAGSKSWEQLDFKLQQQIRLAAILEQAYTNYGDTLQSNVMTKQMMLSEQLKDIKLNLSQAFLPIWDAILPALSELAKAIAYVTEQLARLSYWMAGKDYDKATMGLDKQTGAASGTAQAYEDVAKSAKAARNEIASFDRLNVLGSSSDSGGTGTGGDGGSGGIPTGGAGNTAPNWEMPDLAAAFSKKYKIEFDPPTPPDAGLGAVITTINQNINSLNASIKAKLSQMWNDLQVQTQAGMAGQQAAWQTGFNVLPGVVIPGVSSATTAQWGQLWEGMGTQTNIGMAAINENVNVSLANMLTSFQASRIGVTTEWHQTLDSMQTDLNAYRPYLEYGVNQIGVTVANQSIPLAGWRTDWHYTLDYLQTQLNEYRPYIEYGLALLALAVTAPITPLAELQLAWDGAMSAIHASTVSYLDGILTKIAAVTAAFQAMTQMMGGFAPSTSSGATTPVQPIVPSAAGAANSLGYIFSMENLRNIGDLLKKESDKPVNQIGTAVVGAAATGGALSGLGAASKLGQAGARIKELFEMLKGFGIAVPAFASGALAYGPTLAVVGDNRGAASDPEVIAPLSKLSGMLTPSNDNQEVVAALYAILDALEGQETSIEIDGDQLARVMRAKLRAEDSRIGRSGVTVGGMALR